MEFAELLNIDGELLNLPNYWIIDGELLNLPNYWIIEINMATLRKVSYQEKIDFYGIHIQF